MPNSNAKYTRNTLIRATYRMLGISNPSATEMSQGAETLNALIKEIDVEGRWLHAVSQTPTQLNTVASTQTYTYTETTNEPPAGIAGDILEIERAEVWSSSEPDYALRILSKSQAESSRYREDSGEAEEIYLQRAADAASNQIWIFPTPASVQDIRYYYRRRLYDFDASTDNPDLPPHWGRTLRYGLARDLAPEHGQDAREQLFAARYAEAKVIALRASAENSTPTNVTVPYY